MERGLLWLPLLAIFIGLAWAGWNEYRKLEAYKAWAANFDNAKYDIYAVLGLKGSQLTWGVPTRRGPVKIHHISMNEIKTIQVVDDNKPIDIDNPPSHTNTGALQLILQNDAICNIPFTQIELAIQWEILLKKKGLSS